MRHRIEVAVREALANAIEHGNSGDARRPVRVAAQVDGGVLEVTVVDDGAGFDPSAVPDPRAHEHRLAPRGRGLLLMRSLVDEVAFAPGRVVLRHRLAAPPTTQEAQQP